MASAFDMVLAAINSSNNTPSGVAESLNLSPAYKGRGKAEAKKLVEALATDPSRKDGVFWSEVLRHLASPAKVRIPEQGIPEQVPQVATKATKKTAKKATKKTAKKATKKTAKKAVDRSLPVYREAHRTARAVQAANGGSVMAYKKAYDLHLKKNGVAPYYE